MRARPWAAARRPRWLPNSDDLVVRAVAAVVVVAWASWLWQWPVLYGPRGLLPWATLLGELQAAGVPFGAVPSWLRFVPAAWAPAWLGMGTACAVAAVAAPWPRLWLAVAVATYQGFALLGGTFTSFQWDNLLLEAGALVAVAPRAWRPWLVRLLLCKLYVESGIAKWQSSLGDWQDGSAMASYYETAPLPTWLAWYAHHAPLGWHRLESWGTLALELGVPWAFFAGRRARLVAGALLTGFQLLNAATANYGFFVWLTLALHLGLPHPSAIASARRGCAASVRRAAGLARRIVALCRSTPARPGAAAPPPATPSAPPPPLPTMPESLGTDAPATPAPWSPPRCTASLEAHAPARQVRLLGGTAVAAWLLLSFMGAAAHFGTLPPGAEPLVRAADAWRWVNTYHLFGSITRERIEPELQTLQGDAWQAHWPRHKPGDPRRAPDFVQPHQPRVDFQLWFHGLAPRRQPAYLVALMERLCHDPAAVQPLFADPLPVAPRAVRIVYWRYRFTSGAERRTTGAWWSRTYVGRSGAQSCS